MKFRTILSKLWISAAVVFFILSIVVICNDGFTVKEFDKINLYNKVYKNEMKVKSKQDKIREDKKRQGIIDPPNVPQYEDMQSCYDYDGEESKRADRCLQFRDFSDGSLIKGVVFDLGILLTEVIVMGFLLAWIIWIFEP